MPRKPATPDRRAADVKREVSRVRRKYKVNLNKQRKLLPAEVPHVEDMVVVLKIAGYSRSQMAKVIGISRGQIKDILNKPEITERIVDLRKVLPQAALNLLQGLMIESVMTIADVMRTSNDDNIVLKAAVEILDRGGAPKVSKQERTNTHESKTTFTDDGMVELLRQAPVEVQEQAAQLIEQLENLLIEATGMPVSEGEADSSEA